VSRDARQKIEHAVLVADESGSERRQHERFTLLVDVTLGSNDWSGTLTVLNISAGGLLLRNDQDAPVSVGEQIKVQFDTPELATPFSIDARVIRVVTSANKPAAIAAMWIANDATASSGLSQMLWSLSNRR
jgi:hypothetical protein